MNFFCEKDDLLNPLLIVSKAVSARTPLEILSGILFELEGNNLSLTATNLEMGIKCNLLVNGEKDGNIVLPARQLVELTRRLPDITTSFVTDHESSSTTIAYGESRVEFYGTPGVEYPSLPPIEGYSFGLEGKDLRTILKQILFAAGTDESRPIFTGVFMQIKEGLMTMVATDTHSLALRKLPLENGEHEDKEVIIPGKTLAELNRIISPDSDIKVTVTQNQIFFIIDEVIVMSRLIEGKFPNYEQVIPTSFKATVKVNTKNLLIALERANLLSTDGGQTVELRLLEDKLQIAAATELGSIHEELAMNLEGENFNISFNAKYLIDTLKAIEDEEVTMRFTGSNSAGIVKNSDNDDYLALILPVWLNN